MTHTIPGPSRIRSTALVALTTLCLAATATAAATAHAATPHHGHPKAAMLTVNVTSTKKGPALDVTTIRPGNTVFSMTRGNAAGSIEILRLKSGYTINEAAADFGQLFKGNTAAIKRVDKFVVFYGGAEVPKKGAAQVGFTLDKTGTYYAVNVDKNTLSTFTVKGTAQPRSLPTAGGHLNMLKGNTFPAPSGLPNAGWLKQTNHALEPHFMDFQQVKKSTTRAQVKKFFDNGAKGQPSFGLPATAGTLIVSPGHTIVWKYTLPKGKYVVACFWPSKKTGMPHALMGMWNLLSLG